MKQLSFLIVFIFLVGGCAGPTTVRSEISDVLVAEEAKKQKALSFQSYFDYNTRLDDVAYPLKVAATSICEEKYKTPFAGFSASSSDMFPENLREAAILSGLGDTLKVTHVVTGSPAHSSGLRKGDVLVSYDGKNLPVGNFDRMKTIWDKSTEDGVVDMVVYRDEDEVDIKLIPITACNYPVIYMDDPVINAYADGDAVYIAKGLMRFTNDTELSAIIAHEIGHNAMQHIEASQINTLGGSVLDILIIGTTGIDPNIRAATGRAYSQDFESEADYVGMYIMAKAGLELDNVANLWRRMGVENAGSIEKNLSSSHPSSPERFIGIENAVKEINQKISEGDELSPNLKKE